MRIGLRATVAAVVAAVAASLIGVGISLYVDATDGASMIDAVLSAAVVVSFTAVGAVVAAARPSNRVGWVMLGGGLLWSLGNAFVDLAVKGIAARPGSVNGASAWAVGGSALRGAGWYLVVVGLAILFPDGRLVGPRWRWLPRALVISIGGTVVGAITASDADLTDLGSWRNPIALPPAAQPVSGLLSLGSVLCGAIATIGAVAQLRVRWRRGGPAERQQLIMFGAAVGLTVVAAPIALITGQGWVFSVAALPLPFTIGFCVLAQGLYDLKTAANRTLVWVTLSAVVVGLYALVIAGLGGFLHLAGKPWLPWIAAAIVAVSFAPIRDGLQRWVNRLTFGGWDEPYTVLAALGQRLEATADAERLLTDVVAELHTLGLRNVAIRDHEGALVAGAGAEPQSDSVVMNIIAYGHPLGTLRYCPPSTPLRSRDRQLLSDLTGHLGGVMQTRQLIVDLQRMLERLVLAREEERRRLRRDLHDGLGPALAGHLLQLDVVAGKLGSGASVAEDVDRLRAELRTTVLEVRRVVEGLRPAALDELGLSGALKQSLLRLSAGSSTSVELRVGDLPPLSAALEVAAFRITTEAVSNAIRHAGASRCRVDIRAADDRLRISVTDDGCGVAVDPATSVGNGLQTMRERVEELRGRLRVASDSGTTICAELPLPSSAPSPLRTTPARLS